MSNRVGQQLGNYRLLRLIGRGSFAEVYLGEHLHLGTQAAIKVMYANLSDEGREQLRSEARTMARLIHPHIVRVLDFQVEDGLPFLVMEYAPNGSLRERHPRGTTVPPAIVVSYVRQVAEALHYIHAHKLIHRDVKPENMLLGAQDEVLLTEFDLAIISQSSRSQHTQEALGSVTYMAPEQLQGHPRAASDQYALGVVAYEWLCGSPPFSGQVQQIAMRHLSAPPPSLQAKVPAISSAIDDVILKALAKEPERRFPNVQAFAQALEEAYLSSTPGQARDVRASEQAIAGVRNQRSTPDLPTGTVTLLFTDIEGSTRLLERLGDRYAGVLAECRQVLRTIFQEWNGREVDTQGDAFFIAFARASDAVSAAASAQRALAAHAWPEGAAVRVRMGIHTGEPSRTGEGYVGLDVHRAARIMSAAHGGQVLLSQATATLVDQDLPDDVSLRDLGEHRLKDLGRPRRLFQLAISELPADFPRLKTLDTYQHNLPVQLTPFIGREQELAAVQDLLRREDVRLLTLTGPGGTGKTRLALQAAAELSDHFADGVFFVNLSPISDAALVIPTIAQALDLREGSGLPWQERLREALRAKQILLLLDNFEQVVSAGVEVVDLLAACPRLKLLVTSREVLHVRGEREYAVPALALPDLKHLPDLPALSFNAAVALFLQRAQAVKPDFQLTNANARAIVEICTRLDGLPLAIELAAARVKLLPPQALLSRLEQRLSVLTGASRDIPERQQTLRNAIAWSYNLLDATEQRLFRRLAVFAGGCTLEAAEAVCTAPDKGDGGGQVLDTIGSLIDKSLVQQIEQEGGEPRFMMLETIREYGLERLSANGEAEATRRAHAEYCLAFAERAEPQLKGAQQVFWWRWLEREQENLRAALAWLIGQEEGELALRLSGALWWFWYIRGYWSEGWRWLEAALELPQARGRTAWRARALSGAAELANRLGDHRVHALIEESVAISRELGDKRGLTESLGSLGLSIWQNEAVAARALLEEGLALAREMGDPWILANTLRNFGDFMRYCGDHHSARLFLEESVMLYREIEDQQALSSTLLELVGMMVFAGQATQAVTLAEENLALARALDNGPDLNRALYWLAVTKLHQGDTEQALALLEESLAMARERGYKWQIASTQLTLGGIALYRGDLLQAESCVQECLELYRELHQKHGTAMALSSLGDIRRRQGDFTQAKALCIEGALLAREAGRPDSLGWNILGLALVAADEDQPEQAARLFGAAEPWLNPDVMDALERANYERSVAAVRASIGDKSFATAWAEGRSMTLEQALSAQGPATLSASISAEPSPAPSAKPFPTYPDGLTVREVDVLRLVVQGLTDAQIADQLVISPRTVNNHLTSIYSKIQVSSRAAATRYAMEHQLV